MVSSEKYGNEETNGNMVFPLCGDVIGCTPHSRLPYRRPLQQISAIFTNVWAWEVLIQKCCDVLLLDRKTLTHWI